MPGSIQELFAAFPEPSVETPSPTLVCDQSTATDGLFVQVAASMSAVEELRPIWKNWSRSIDTDFDYYLHNLKNDSTILNPYVITVSRDGVAEAMLVGQVRKQRISTIVSFVNIRGPKARVLEIIHGGRMGGQSAAADRLFALQLCQAARHGDVDLISFKRLALQSDLFRMLRKCSGFSIKERIPHVFRYSVTPLTAPAGKHARALSGKNRREVRRKTRILQRAFPGKAQVRSYSQPGELDAGLRDATAVDLNTWQHYLGSGLLDVQRNHENLEFCARQGWLRIYVMYVDQFPVAFLIGQHYKQTFYCQHAGYHPDFSRFSVGSLLTAWVLEHLAAAGVEQVDLGEGDQEHNRRLGCLACEEGTVHLYALTLRGVSMNMLIAATQTIRATGRRTIKKLRFNRASKAWSRFLISRWKARTRMGDLCP